MTKRHDLQAGSGAFGNAMRGWLYFGDDAPNLPPGKPKSTPRVPRPSQNLHAQKHAGKSHLLESKQPAAKEAPPSSVPRAIRYELGHQFEIELEQVIAYRVAERTGELEKTIENLRERQRQLEVQAHYDALTGLANRKLLQDRFQTAVERAKRSGDSFALLMIDLDGFKAVNDRHGHLAGDQVLATIAQRLVANSRNCDTAARVGGDEFVLIVESIHDASEVAGIAHKLLKALSQDIQIDEENTVTVGASMGVALYPDDGDGLSQILSVADLAMYECKSSGQMAL
jgi:diguanylate cyclase (GGDEF)-like protein